MDINLMVLNVGNSRLAVGVFQAGELSHVSRLAHDEKDRLAEVIAEAWSKIENSEDPAIVGASVNPTAMEAIEHLVQQKTGQKVEWVGTDIDLPIKVLTENPTETGADRVVNVAAAYEQLGKAC